MKKVAYLLIITVVLALFSNVVLAANESSFGIGVSATKTSINPGDEITVTVKLKDFKNITEGLYAFSALIQYDNNVFETLTENSVKGLGTWSSLPTFNPETGLITADSGVGVKTESDAFSITFKVKDNAEIGKSTQITVKDFEASEGDADISANASGILTINIVEKNTANNSSSNNSSTNSSTNNSSNNSSANSSSNSNTNSSNNNSSNNNSSTNNSTNSGIKNSTNSGTTISNNKDNSTASKNIPQTGEKDFIILGAIAIISIMLIIGYLGYRKYGKI